MQNGNQPAFFNVTTEDKGRASRNTKAGTRGCRQCFAIVGTDTNLRLCIDRLALWRLIVPLLPITDIAVLQAYVC